MSNSMMTCWLFTQFTIILFGSVIVSKLEEIIKNNKNKTP